MQGAQALLAQADALEAQAGVLRALAATWVPPQPTADPIRIEGKRTLGPSEVAKLIGCTPCTFHRMRTRGEWPAPDLAISNRPRWHATTVERLLPSVVKE